MYETEKPVLKVLRGEKPDRTPVWLMRQAGRYLPEYMELRKKAGNFLDLCLTPEWASDITLQPIRRFGLDAAILFADILLVPMALGVKLEFREGEGPVLQPVENENAIDKLLFDNEKTLPVYETIVRVKSELHRNTALIGFCGAPWTVACYMIDGNSKTGFTKAKAWVAEKPALLGKLIATLVGASEIYLNEQIDAGAEALQIFDSWAGLIEGKDFTRWVIEPTRELVNRIKAKHPHIPVIGFPREAANEGYRDYILKTGVDALSIDTAMSLDYAKKQLQPVKPLQGNLNPQILVKGGDTMKNAAAKILNTFGPLHIFNLGHGVVPETPPEHVAELVDFVHNFTFPA